MPQTENHGILDDIKEDEETPDVEMEEENTPR